MSEMSAANPGFVAINFIRCEDWYRSRFEELFKTRARAIDTLPGFHRMEVLRPNGDEGEYLVVSHWDTQEEFESWTKSPEFIEGHKRGFEDLRKAKEEGKEPPMKSTFKTYSVLCR